MDKLFVTLTAAQQVICDTCGRPSCPRLWGCGCDRIDRLIAISAADVRPVVHGKWVFETGDGKTCVDGWVCTNCNCGFHTNVPYFEGFNFCPNCGAYMRETNLDITKAKGDNHD